MSWLTSYVRPRINKLVNRDEVPDNLWSKCPNSKCGQMIFNQELAKNLHVCPFCDHHQQMPIAARFASLFDAGKYQTVALRDVPLDPLKFRDKKKYSDRLKETQAKTGKKDAMQVAFGAIAGHPLVVALFDFSFMGGSMGTAVGEALLVAAEKAVKEHAPLLVIPASGGARMQEGILSLMQMPRTIIAAEMVRAAGLPYLVLLANPTTGGVTASFAMLGDIQLAEKGAVIGFAGARVIESTVREKLPEGFQTAEYLEENGIVDAVVHRRDLRQTLAKIIDLVRTPHRTEAISLNPDQPLDDSAAERVSGEVISPR